MIRATLLALTLALAACTAPAPPEDETAAPLSPLAEPAAPVTEQALSPAARCPGDDDGIGGTGCRID